MAVILASVRAITADRSISPDELFDFAITRRKAS
jgi:hypothetical protein